MKPILLNIVLLSTHMLIASMVFSQSEYNDDILTEKGKWYIYMYSKKFDCSEPIVVEHHPGGKLEGNLSLQLTNCASAVSKELLKEFAFNMYHYGTRPILFDHIWLNDSISWSSIDLRAERPDSIRFIHFRFVATSDSSYDVFESGKLILEDFKDRYLENCISKSDTLEVIRTKMIGKDDWIVKAPCKPFFFSKSANKNSIHDNENWEIYSVKCNYADKTTERTIALNSSDGTFRWEWDVGGSATQITSGYYELTGDSLLVLNSDPALHEDFLSFYNESSKDNQGIPRYVINRSFLLKEDKIYYVNVYR